MKSMMTVFDHLQKMDTMPMSYESNDEEHSHNEAEAINSYEQLLKQYQEEEFSPLSTIHEDAGDEVVERYSITEDDIDEETLDAMTQLAEQDQLRYEDLPPSLQYLFHQSIRDGQLTEYIKPWKPWWLSDLKQHHTDVLNQRNELIQVVESEEHTHEQSDSKSDANDSENTLFIPCYSFKPSTFPALPILPSKVSPCLSFNLISIFYSYCLLLRKYNGDIHEDLEGFISTLYELALPLTKNVNYSDISSVFHFLSFLFPVVCTRLLTELDSEQIAGCLPTLCHIHLEGLAFHSQLQTLCYGCPL